MALTLLTGAAVLAVSPAHAAAPPFTQCPAIGSAQSCEILLDVGHDGSITVATDPAVGPYDGSDDTLVGIVNHSTASVTAVTVTGPGTGLSGFDGDGICSGAFGTWNGSAGCPYGPTGYEGPGTGFVTSASRPDSAEVDFPKGLVPGAAAYFSLEGALASAKLTAHEGGLDSFTVNGSLTNIDPGTQDTHAADPKSVCNPIAKVGAIAVGYTAVAGMALTGAPTGANLLLHFLGGSGTAVHYTQTDTPGRELLTDSAFTSLNNDIVTAVTGQLDTGNTTISLPTPAMRTITLGGLVPLTSGWDLYFGFRGTQYLSITGTGSVTNGKYVGSITYVIGDNYGFATHHTLLDFGPPMRYLQVNCGDTPGAAHYFYDDITVTVPFTKPAGPIWTTSHGTRTNATPDKRSPTGSPTVTPTMNPTVTPSGTPQHHAPSAPATTPPHR